MRPRIGLSVMPLETRREAIIGLATEGDRLGYDDFFMPETWAYDMTVLLAEAAARTTRITLGTGILGIWNRSAATIAMAATTLHAMSDGRFVLGLGASTPQLAEGLHDTPFEPPVPRMRRMVTQIRALLRGERIPLAVTTNARALKLNVPPAPALPTRGHPSSIRGRSSQPASNGSARARREVAIRIASRRFIPRCRSWWPPPTRRRVRARRGSSPSM